MATTFQVTFDAADPRALGQFWCQVLGYVEEPVPEGFDSWPDALAAWGVPEDQRDSRYAIVDPDGRGPRIYLQKVPEPKTAKNRVHLDVNVSHARDDGGLGVLRGEAARLAGLGAAVVREYDEDGEAWIVMTDPEGNEFCLQ